VADPCGIAVAPTTEASPASHAFADTEVGAESDIQALFVANTASSVLDVSELNLSGANPEDFEITGDACTAGPSPPGGGCVVNVRFNPTATGARTATLSATSNASDSPTAVALSGNGTPATGGGDPGGGDPPDGTAPELSDVRVKPARFSVDPAGAAEVPLPRRRGTRFSWALSELALVAIGIERKVDGRIVNGTCVRERPGNRDNPECTFLKFIGSFAAQSPAGPGGKEFSGRIGNRRLREGAYQATVQALDASFNFSVPSRVGFRVVERRR
jgi:hypothetical protein